jgi:hypothetical protein
VVFWARKWIIGPGRPKTFYQAQYAKKNRQLCHDVLIVVGNDQQMKLREEVLQFVRKISKH